MLKISNSAFYRHLVKKISDTPIAHFPNFKKFTLRVLANLRYRRIGILRYRRAG